MENKKSIGLPGGPNEFLKEITQHISVEGYKRYSKDVNNPYNIIESGNITMEDVDFPVMGTDNYGNQKMMYPGNDYKFPGDQVFEVPMARSGGGLLTKTMKCNSCGWKWKAADGGNDVSTCHKCGGEAAASSNEFQSGGEYNPDVWGVWDIPVETQVSDNTTRVQTDLEALTNIKPKPVPTPASIKYTKGYVPPKPEQTYEEFKEETLNQPSLSNEEKLKQQVPTTFEAPSYSQNATLSEYTPPSLMSKGLNRLANPLTTLGYYATGELMPDMVEDKGHPMDMALEMANPAAWLDYGRQSYNNIQQGNYGMAGLTALGALPVVPAWLAQGKNATKAGKNVIKNAAKYTDEVFASSDDIAKATVKDAKPRAARFDAVTEVNPLSQAQARNLAEQGRNAEIFKAFEEGANTIDDFVKSYTGDLNSPEGFKRLVQQEADYLRTIGFDEARIATQAEINAGARLNEIINIGNTNRAISKGEKAVNAVIDNKYNFNNASYSPNTRNVEWLDDLFYKPGMDTGPFTLNRTKVGSKILPGQTNLGTMFNNSKAVAAHEIGGHGLQSGRRLPVDLRLKKLEPLDKMNEGTAEAYRYFMQGSKGKEPSAYLHELRQAMLDNKLIRNRYDYVSPEQLKRYQTLFDLRPSGTVNTMGNKFHSDTRILDFMKPTQSNFDLLARELNKLPAMVPIGVAGAAGAAALPQEKYGGQLPKAQSGNGEYTVKSGDTFYGIANKNNISKEDLIKANPGLDIQNLKLNQSIKLPTQVVQKKVQAPVQKPEETSWSDYVNPWNWGVSDRDDDGDFKQAFRAARKAGEDEFMWYGTRYTTDLKDEPVSKQPSYNPKVLEGLTEKQKARRQSLLNAANVVAKSQNNDENLKRLLALTAGMESTLGADATAYGRNYTRGPMSIDDIAYDDLFKVRPKSKGYTATQLKQFEWLKSLGYDYKNMDQVLRTDDPVAGMAAARMVYGRSPDALPDGSDPKALYNYYLKYYNKGGVEKHGGSKEHEQRWNDLYNDLYKFQNDKLPTNQEGGEIDNLTIYKNYIDGVYDNTPEEKQAQKVYDKLNRLHYRDAKAKQMTPANYVLTYITG